MERSLSFSSVQRAVMERNRAKMNCCVCRDPQASPADHAPYSPWQTSASFSSLWSLRGRTARPRHRESSELPLPSMLPAAEPPALPARLPGLLPLIRGRAVAEGGGSEEGGRQAPLRGQGWEREAKALHGAAGALAGARLLLAASAAAGTGARLPKEGPRGLWLTDEPHGRLSQGGLSILQVRQALIQVFFSPAPVLHQLERAQGYGHVTEPPQLARAEPPPSTPSC